VEVNGEEKPNKYQDSLCLNVTEKEKKKAHVDDTGITATESVCG